MNQFRARVLTGFIACGLLFLNLGGLVFAFAADAPVVSSSHTPDGDDSDETVALDLATGSFVRCDGFRPLPAPSPAPAPPPFCPSFFPRHSSLKWHFVERVAAAPRAPSSLV